MTKKCKLNFLRDAGVYIFLFMLVVIAMYISNVYTTLKGDIGDGAYGVYASLAQSLARGEYPFWNPYLMSGIPNVGSTTSHVFYPITILLCKILYNEEAGYLSPMIMYYLAVIHLSIFACGSYYLFRILKIRRSISFVISTLICFSGMVFFFVKWNALFCGFSYFPLIWAFSIQMMEKLTDRKTWRYCALNGMTLGIIGLACASHSLLLAVLQYAIIFFIYVFKYRDDKEALLKLIKVTVISGVLGALISLVVLLPFIKFLGQSYRFVSDADIQGTAKMSYEAFTVGTVEGENLSGILGANSGIMGCSVIFTIWIYASFFWKGDKHGSVFYAAQASFIFAFCYSIAFAFPEIFYYIPFYQQMREPYLFVPLMFIAAGILTGIVLEGILASGFKLNLFYNPVVLFLGIIVILTINILPKNITIYSVISILLLGILLYVLYKRLNKCYLITILMLCFGIANFAGAISNSYKSNSFRFEDLEERVEKSVKSMGEVYGADIPSDKNPYRILAWTQQTEGCYPSNIAGVIGGYDAFGYLNPIYAKYMNMHVGWNLDKRVFLNNVRYLLVSTTDTEDFINWIESLGFKREREIPSVYSSYNAETAESLILYSLDKYGESSNAWMVYDYESYDDETTEDELNQKINSEDFLPQKEALVNGELKWNSEYNIESDNKVVLYEYNSNSVKLSVMTESPGILTTSDIIDSDWEVYVDGEKAEMLEVNSTFRGVEVSDGQHEVVFKYEPKVVYIGLMCAFMGIFFVVVLLIFSYRRNKYAMEE